MLSMNKMTLEAIEKKIKRKFPNLDVEIESINVDREVSFRYGGQKLEVYIKISGYSGLLLKFDDVGMTIENVIFNDPATIVYWIDGTKTVVKCSEDEEFDPEKGLAMAISKKALGNMGNYYNEFKKWLPEPEEKYHEALSRNMKIVEESKPS